MAEQNGIVVAQFADRNQMRDALAALKQAHFSDKQLGFVVRDERGRHPKHTADTNRAHPVLRGLVGGIMGIADALLVPITGPADATNILAATLPVAEDAIDHLPQRQRHQQKIERPDAPMTASKAETAAEPTPAPVSESEEDGSEDEEEQTSTITGEVVGGVLGAAVGVLIPGIGPAIVVGSLAGLFGAAFGGVGGNFLGTFTHLGVPESQARKYAQALKEGQAIVTIQAGERLEEAQAILREHGAQRVETH